MVNPIQQDNTGDVGTSECKYIGRVAWIPGICFHPGEVHIGRMCPIVFEEGTCPYVNKDRAPTC